VVAFYNQNELHQVAPGNEVELALKTLPGRVIKGKVDSVVWAQGQGTAMASGDLPSSLSVQNQPPGKFAVKFDIAERDRAVFLAAGAAGDAAIYTEHLEAVHIIRKIILRVGSYLNYLILKLH
jgi:multidrug resistance efflux pump